MSTSENESLELTPQNIVEPAKITSLNVLPEISKKKYETAYKLFMEWRQNQKISSYSENVLMAYFREISKNYKSSTLWTQYSMLRTTLNINNNVDIAKYSKLRAFLKRQSAGYRPKKSKIFTAYEINKFIKEAPDEQYLLTKVSLIMGIMGACRRHELHQMKTTNFNDLGSAVLVTIPDTKTKIVRKFTITGHFYDLFKKYANLRPPNVNDSCFFMNYQKGKCTVQKVGINKFGAMGKLIAKYLKLPNAESYTGHCFRRSSATILVDADEDVTSLERHGGWKSTTVAKQYIDASMKDKLDVANEIVSSIENNTTNMPSTSRTENWENQDNLTFQQNCANSPKMKSLKSTDTNDEYSLTSSSESSAVEENETELKKFMRKCTFMAIERQPKLYLGLPKKCYFIVAILAEKAPAHTINILIALKKIRLNDSFSILANDFGMSVSDISRIYKNTLPVLAQMFQELILWPTTKQIQSSLPIPFRPKYGKVQSIIDFLEIEIEKPSNPIHQALTWSDYKGCNTLKYLISCTPSGFVNFISRGYGGRASDVTIVEDCGYLDRLSPGMAVMADRGCKNLTTAIEHEGCRLIRLSSVSAAEVSAPQEVKQPKRIAALRIHVDRVLGTLRDFAILLPNARIDHNYINTFDYVIIVACGIINMQDYLIKIN